MTIGDVLQELLTLERRAWAALTSGGDTEFCERVLAEDMVLVLPGMLLDRHAAVESWFKAMPWRVFELEDARVVPLAPGAAVLTYRATANRSVGVASYRAQCTSVYRRSFGRWQLVFQQQTPFSSEEHGVGGAHVGSGPVDLPLAERQQTGGDQPRGQSGEQQQRKEVEVAGG